MHVFGSAIQNLTPKEFALMRALTEARGGVVSREQLHKRLFPRGPRRETRTVDQHVSRLRRKLRRASPRPIIRTVCPRGYALAVGAY